MSRLPCDLLLALDLRPWVATVTFHVVECSRCFRSRWHATGAFNQNRHGLRRAECVCECCGYAFSSGRPEAIAAALAVRGVVEKEPEAGDLRVPQPTLPHSRRSDRPADFVTTGELARRAIGDYKRRQSGSE